LRLRLLSDKRLARRAENGDRRALAAIYRRYYRNLYRFCLAMTGDPEQAREAAGRTLQQARRGLIQGERQIALKPWLYRIVRNETADPLRMPRDTGALGAEQRQLLADLERLPKQQRAILVMRELSGLDFDQIGAAFGITAEAALEAAYSAQLKLKELDSGHRCRRGLAAALPLPFAGGTGTGLAGTSTAALGEFVGSSVALKATATVAVVAVAGLSAAERNRQIDSPAQPGKVAPGSSWREIDRPSSPPSAVREISAVATRRSVPGPSAPSYPDPVVQLDEPSAAHDLTRPGPADEAAAPNGGSANSSPPIADQYQLVSQPHEDVDAPLDEAMNEPYEAEVSETTPTVPSQGAEVPAENEEESASPGPEPSAMPTTPLIEAEMPTAPPSPPAYDPGSRRSGDDYRGRRPRHRH